MTHAYDPATPQLLRAHLEEKLNATLRRQLGVQNRRRHTAELLEKWADRAPLMGDEEMLSELDAEGRHEVEAIRAALERLDAGTYGICTGCEEPIPAARLTALPTAHTCVDCAE